MKPVEIAFEYGQSLPEFENLQKAEEYFFSVIEVCGTNLKKLFSDGFEVDLQYSFDFLDTFDKIVIECISSRKYQSIGFTPEQFNQLLGVYFGDFAVKNRFGKWVVRENLLVKNRFDLAIEEANGYCYHSGLWLSSANYNTNNNKSVVLKLFTEKFHLPKLFQSKILKEELINSINNFNDDRYSLVNSTKTVSTEEIENFRRFDILPHLNDIELFLKQERKAKPRDVIYRYLQYYCWRTQNPVVCQFLIDRLKFEDSVSIRKQFFWSRLNRIENLESYEISELLRIANDTTDKNFIHCQDLLNKKKINYR
jgi:hypothetical protein